MNAGPLLSAQSTGLWLQCSVTHANSKLPHWNLNPVRLGPAFLLSSPTIELARLERQPKRGDR